VRNRDTGMEQIIENFQDIYKYNSGKKDGTLQQARSTSDRQIVYGALLYSPDDSRVL
jgi:hypothetical protein